MYLILFSVVFAMFTWSSAFVSIRYVVGYISPEDLSFARFLIASVAMLVILLLTKKISEIKLLMNKKSLLLVTISSLSGVSLYNIFLNSGEQYISAGLTAFIVAQAPFVGIILSSIFLRERLNRQNYLGFIISTIGVTLIFLFSGADNNSTMKGIIFILLATILSASFSVVQKPLTEKASPVVAISLSIWLGTLCLLPFSYSSLRSLNLLPLPVTVNIVYLGIFPAALAYVAWSYAISKKGVKKIIPACYSIPVISSILSFLFLHEKVPTLVIVGGVIAIFGVYVSSKKPASSLNPQSE